MIFTQPITRLRAATRVNRGGDTVLDWSTPDQLVVPSNSVQPNSQSESVTAQQDTRVTRYRVYTNPDLPVPDITALDRISFNGDTYELDGEVASWPDPWTGQPHHLEFSMRLVAGG